MSNLHEQLVERVAWVTAAPNPRAFAGGFDAGRHAWKRHAVPAESTETFLEIRSRRAACGLLARHGWDDDLFIPEVDEFTDYRCKRCRRALGISLLNPVELRVARIQSEVTHGE